MKKTLSAVLIGAYGTNIGDNAILLGILRQMDETLKRRDYYGKFYVFTNYPNYLRNNLEQVNELRSDVIFLKITNLLRIILSLMKSDILIWGGGGMVVDDWRVFFSSVYLIPILLAHILRRHIVVYSIGASIPESSIGRFMTRNVLSLAHLITVRDINSKKALLAIGIKKSIKVYPDPSLVLKSIPIENKYTLLKGKSVKDGFIVALSLRYIFKYSKKKIDHRYLINEIVAFLEDIIKEYNATVLFIPFNKHPKKWFENDLIVGNLLKQKVSKKERFIIIRDVNNPEKVISLFKSADLLVGTRLHSVILGAVAGIPIIGISGDAKVSNFLSTVGLSEFSTYPDASRLHEKLLKLFKKIIEDKENIQKILMDRTSFLVQKAQELPEVVLAGMGKWM